MGAKTEPTETTAKMTTEDVTKAVNQIYTIIDEGTEDAAEQVIAVGRTLMRIGVILRGMDKTTAQRVIRSAAVMHGIEV